MEEKQYQILTEALAMRDAEVLGYQINIDNYTRAIAKIDEFPEITDDLKAFREQLVGLLSSEQREQTKAQIMRDVIADQIK